MARVIKRNPLAEEWARNAFCKYKNPDLWDLDTTLWKVGRRHCVRDCTIREACLRKALQDGDTEGVVRGGVAFTTEQRKKKKTECLFCRFPIAPLVRGTEGDVVKSLCWICRNYASCLRGCGRMVLRKPGMGSYHCDYCNN